MSFHELNAKKVEKLIEVFGAALEKSSNNSERIPGRTLNEWLRKSDPLIVNGASFRNLGNFIRRISSGVWNGDDLLASNPTTIEEFASKLEQFRKAGDQPFSPSFIDSYNCDWIEIFEAVLAEKEPEVQRLKSRWYSLSKLRLRQYIWPRLATRFGTPAMARGERRNPWSELPVRGEDAAWNILSKLKKEKILVMHHDAGVGKTAFTTRLFHLLLNRGDALRIPKHHAVEDWCLVVRFEGVWPRDLDGNPLSLTDALCDEIMGVRRGGDPTKPVPTPTITSDQRARALNEVNKASQEKRIFILLDAFDQMSESDRDVAANVIKGSLGGEDLDGVHWFITGRSYALRPYSAADQVFHDKVRRVRLMRLNPEEQDRYFEDLAKIDFFRHQPPNRQKPLDYLCRNRKLMKRELGIPLHLFEIRKLIEIELDAIGERPRRQLSQISNSSDLHKRVSDVLLERAFRQPIPEQGSWKPSDPNEGLSTLRHVCGVLAWQMMLDENRNANIFRGAQLSSYRDSIDVVQAYEQRCKNRFLATSSQANAADKWSWAMEILRRNEFTHRGDIDVFTPECKAFRDRKTMEWYAAHYLMNHIATNELNKAIPNAGDRCAADFVGKPEWNRCWRLALSMPDSSVNQSTVSRSIGLLFQPGLTVERPCELMYRAWERWLEPRSSERWSRQTPLNDAGEIINNFRSQFGMLYESQKLEVKELARTLRLDPERDQPQQSLPDPNKNPKGWYRRIPPNGSTSRFKGERPAAVEVSAFWLRKFVVTIAEYRLFDANYGNETTDQPDLVERPAVNVNWYMATMFCRWLGNDYRLPTEAEWETACRGEGRESTYWFGEREEDLAKHAWFHGNSDGREHTLKESIEEGGHENVFGLIDMHGNVWEWCKDWYDSYLPETTVDPQGPNSGSVRVYRCGSWGSDAEGCRSAYRDGYVPTYRLRCIGFRLALSSVKSSEAKE